MDNPEYTPKSPLEALSYGRFGGKTFAQESKVVLGTTTSVMLRNDPNRLFWSMVNEGINDVHLSFDPTINTGSGWLVPANGGVITMFWEEDGESVGYTVYAYAGGILNNVRVREVKRL